LFVIQAEHGGTGQRCDVKSATVQPVLIHK
jgi:hypothetical protein